MNSITTFRTFTSFLLLAASQVLPGRSAPALERVANTTLQMPQVPQSLGFRTENAFGNLTFSQPVAIKAPPGETNRLFVVEQSGRIHVITNLAAPTKTLFLDLSKQTRVDGLEGLFALAFHPGYSSNGHFVVGYNLNTTTAAGTGPHYRVARFAVSSDNPNHASTNTELPLITQHYSSAVVCDDLLFGADGSLFVSVGDPGGQTGGGPSANRIDLDLFSGILRIDVDKGSDSVLPNPHPAISANYTIPSDNPFIGATQFNGVSVDPAKVRTEFYAVGLRNPWRMSLDELSGLLYVGDPGSSSRDEINVVVKGGNYGWPFREGTLAGPKSGQTPPGFISIDPIYQYANPSAVIGGLVYRGNRYPDLDGAYIFGDWVSGGISALRYAGTNPVAPRGLAAQPGVVAFGLDPGSGQVLVVDREGGRIMRLTYSGSLVGRPLPGTLADTGAFADLQSLTPHPGIVPYDLNVPFWSDRAHKTRWFSLPRTNLSIGFSREANWSFPAGAVWIKHFELELTNGVPASARRLETRLLVRNATGLYGLTYRWGDSLTNAVLVPEEGMDETFLIHDGENVRSQVWRYPSRSECLTCHTPLAGHALGFNTAQLNRDFAYGHTVENQLHALSKAGYFDTEVTEFHTLPALAHATNSSVSLEYRARSYLAANCVQCHQPGGAARGSFDARLTTPFSVAGLVNGALVDDLGNPVNRVIKPGSPDLSALFGRVANPGPNHMPPLATSVLNSEAIELLSAWITDSLPHYQSYGDWQLVHFGTPTNPNALPDADADQDGASNHLEFLVGTHPLAPGDAWTIAVNQAGGQVEIDFVRPANRAVEIQWRTDLSVPDSWSALDVPGNGPFFPASKTTLRIVDPLSIGASRFYRARVIEP
jgi:uncharacterized repeat protein (TIGR03806 family)